MLFRMYNFDKDIVTIKKLLKIRIFEKKLLELFNNGKINGTTHTCIGQEEVPVSIMNNVLKNDFIYLFQLFFLTHCGTILSISPFRQSDHPTSPSRNGIAPHRPLLRIGCVHGIKEAKACGVRWGLWPRRGTGAIRLVFV